MRITLKTIKRLMERDVPIIVGPSIATAVEEYLIENPPAGYEHPSTHPATMITEDASHRFVTDTEKGIYNGKQDALGFTPVADNDSRLSDSRPASDVYTWAKAATKPAYTYTETGAEQANANIQAHVISTHAPSNAQANADITKAEIEAKLIGEISSHTHAGGGGGLSHPQIMSRISVGF